MHRQRPDQGSLHLCRMVSRAHLVPLSVPLPELAAIFTQTRLWHLPLIYDVAVALASQLEGPAVPCKTPGTLPKASISTRYSPEAELIYIVLQGPRSSRGLATHLAAPHLELPRGSSPPSLTRPGTSLQAETPPLLVPYPSWGTPRSLQPAPHPWPGCSAPRRRCTQPLLPWLRLPSGQRQQTTKQAEALTERYVTETCTPLLQPYSF